MDAVDVEKGKRQKGKELLEGKRSHFVHNADYTKNEWKLMGKWFRRQS